MGAAGADDHLAASRARSAGPRPSRESTRIRQAVRPTPAVTVVVGIRRSFASGGNVPATPSMVQAVARP